MGRSCCPSDVSDVTMMNIGGIKIGMIAVSKIFQKLYKLGIKPEDIKKEELISEFSIYNYIPQEAYNEYAEVLMEEFRKYCIKIAK